jgi:hypothetical protein
MSETVARWHQAMVAWTARAIIGAAVVLVSIMCLAANAEEPRKPNGDSFYKGHRLTTFLDEATRRASIRLDGREIVAKADVAQIGQITTAELATSILFYLHMKTVAGCGSYVFVQVSLLADAGKNEVLSDFGACNDRLTLALQRRPTWTTWYAIAFRDDRATARVAFGKDERLSTRDVRARPCLFTTTSKKEECHQAMIAEAIGSGNLGLPTGAGAFADQKIVTFLNLSTGKATLQLNGRVFRTFDNAKDFYLASVNGENQFGLFVFFLKQATGCSMRPLIFFAGQASQPEVITDFAPCTDEMARQTRKNKDNTIQSWSGIAFHPGERLGYTVSVTDNKLSMGTMTLPACIMDTDRARISRCALDALGAPPPSPQPPQIQVIPRPPPPSRASPPTPRTLGI